MNKRFLFLTISFLIGFLGFSQNFIMQNGQTVQTCSGVFYDSGGANGNYGNGQNLTYTICPPTGNDDTVIQIAFTAFDLELNADFLRIYDGNSTAAPLIGEYTGNTPPLTIQASGTNTSGCITFQFTSDTHTSKPGWAANISCQTPCPEMTAVVNTSTPAIVDNTLKVCAGAPVSLEAGVNTISTGTFTYQWEMGDDTTIQGQNAVHTYDTPGVYRVSMRATDQFGCFTTNSLGLNILVSPEPTINTTITKTDLCFNENYSFEITPSYPNITYDCTPAVEELTFLPDGNNATYNAYIYVDCFEPDQTLQTVDDFLSICVNMEHSYIGDLSIRLISPSGQSVLLKKFIYGEIGSGNYLGHPWDVNSNLAPGDGLEYCFAEDATTLLINGPTIPALNSPGNTIAPGTYKPSESFASLVGSTLNGVWTLQVKDNRSIDNGYIFGWGLTFSEEITPDDLSFQAQVTDISWESNPDIVSTNQGNIEIKSQIAGERCYTAHITNDFGCTYDVEYCFNVYNEITFNEVSDKEACIDGNGDAIFQLNDYIAEISSNANHSISFFGSLADAEGEQNELENTQTVNVAGGPKTVYIRIKDLTTECVVYDTFLLIPMDCNLSLNHLPNIVQCDNNQVFDLTPYINQVYGGNSNYNVTFHTSEPDALNLQNPIGNADLSNYTATSNGQEIFVRVTNIYNQNVFSTTSFQLWYFENPTANNFVDYTVCNNGNGEGVFDLSTIGINPLNNVVNHSVSFYTTEAAANSGLVADQLPMNYTTPATTIYARVENPNTGCFTVVPQELLVVAAIQTTEPAPYVLCDFLNDGREVFNLRSRETEIVGSPIPAGLVFSYHETEEDATLNQNQIVTADAYQNIVLGGQTIYVRVAYENSNCFEVVPMQLVLNPTPDTLDTASISLCDVSNNGAEVYDLTSLAETILNGLNPADYTLTYHTTQGNAEAGTPAISNPSSFSNLTANSVFVRVTDNTSGCYSITRVSLKLLATPIVPNVVPTYELCDTNHDGYATFMLETRIAQIIGNQEGLAVSFHLNEADAESNANALPMVYQNAQINVQTLYVRVTNPSTGCYSITTMDIRVEPNPYLDVPTEPYQICNIAGTGGFGSIDLTEYGDELREGTPFTITYYETQVQAEAALNPIANPQAYSNLEASNPVVWLRVVNPTTGCFSIYSISFELIAPPSMPVSLDELSTCDTLGDIYDGLGTIDLTQQTAAILEANNGNIDGFVIHYYDNEADAQAGVDWITNPTAFQNTSNPQTIWVSIENEQNPTGCRRVRSFEIRIHKSQKLKNPEPISQCETSLPNQGHELFDLTSRELSILNNIQTFGITFTYYTSADDMENDTNAIANPEQYMSTSANQTIYIKVTNQYGCVSTTTLQIRVVPLPEVEENPAAVEVCETAYGSGQGIFDLTEAAFEISNEVPNLILTYYRTEQAALNQDANGLIADPTNYTSTSGFVYVHVSRANAAANENCPIVVALPIKVNPLPTLGQLTPLYACIENTTGFYEFDLHDKDAQVLAGQNPENFSIKYYTTEELALNDETPVPYIYTNVVAEQQELFVRIENLETGCFQIGSFLLRVEEEVKAFMPQNTTFCEMDFVNDGTTPADLTVMDQQIMGTQNAGPLAVRYYTADGTAIADPTNHTITEGETIIAEVYVTTQGFLCTARVEVVVHTQDGPEIADIADGIICFNFRDASEIVQSYLMDTGLPASDDYQYEWTLDGAAIGENSPTHEAVLEGTYQVTVTYLPTGCSNSRTIVVQKATAIVMDEVIQSQSFEETTAIQIIAMAEGGVDLEYQLDEGEWQDSNIFEDVTPGEHIVRVRVKGATLECPAEMVIQIMSHPQYFTPNGDGFNDTWNIKALKNQPEAKVYIFDRYGKLLKELSPSGPGWDGTINGEPMPSTDYWFKATYIDPKTGLEKEVTGHFSLKR